MCQVPVGGWQRRAFTVKSVPMRAAGIDIGGTKIAAQVFDATLTCVAERRVETPEDYDALLDAVDGLVDWAAADVVGVATAGVIHPETGLAIAANVAIDGRAFPLDLGKRIGRDVPVINDARAMVLSEAVFGAGRDARRVLGLALGTGVGGGFVADRRLVSGQDRLGGEFGHMSLPASVVVRHGLPMIDCGCGRVGCVETLISGPGLSRIAGHVLGRDLSPAEAGDVAEVREVWLEILAQHLSDLSLAFDPDVIVLGGGLSEVPNLADDLTVALKAVHLPGLPIAKVCISEGGDASGARGAAYHAWSLGSDA